MGYLKIPNLYKDRTIQLFKECYALEKIHGTSAHLKFAEGKLTFFSGGVGHLSFTRLFDVESLAAKFAEVGATEITVFGEAYGGKCQGMSETYGTRLRFTAFDVKIGESWLAVPNAKAVCDSLGVEFVHYWATETDDSCLNFIRDLSSPQAVRNLGVIAGSMKIMEGIVLRPLTEMVSAYGRVIVKHKRPEFSERASKKDTSLDPTQAQVLADARAIAQEWVTPMRLTHVLGKLGPVGIEDTRRVIEAMCADVLVEAGDEIVKSKAAMREIGSATAKLFKGTL